MPQLAPATPSRSHDSGQASLVAQRCNRHWKCRGCASAYLDLRPIQASVHPKAAASGQDFPVYQGRVDYLDGQSDLFDVITLSHVIEHVHDPIDTLRRCHALLKSHGQLWLETPNIDGVGHALFGRHWRGLEPPRHLTLFNRLSIEMALNRTGFRRLRDRRRPNPCPSTFQASMDLVLALPYPVDLPLTPDLRRAVRRAAFQARFSPSRREFLTVTATK